jgi:hypothetical protein
VVYKTKNDKRRTRILPTSAPHIGLDIRGITHEVLKLKLRSGEAFAIDLAGAQYGYHEPVMSWQDYEQERILQIFRSGRGPKPREMLQIHDYRPRTLISFVEKMTQPKSKGRMVLGDHLEAMNYFMLEWQLDGKLSIKNVLALPERDFVRKQANLIDFIDWKLHNGKKPYFTVNGSHLANEMKGGGWVFAS